MRNACFPTATWLLLVLCAAAAVPAAVAQNQPEVVPHYDNTYRIFHLGLHAAEVLAWEQCADKTRCRVTGSTSNEGTFISVRADVGVHEKIARALAREDAAPRTQVFQILLLEAGAGPAQAPPELPADAARALADLQGFLPYTSYRLLDSVWVRATRGVRARLVAGGGASLETTLEFRRVGDSSADRLFVDAFRLREEGDSPALVNAKGERRGPRMLLDTSFELAVGETIVVGTSRIDGADQALVILLTAAPESAP
jgi:hypothetical protein